VLEQGGNVLRVKSGGSIIVDTGGAIGPAAGQAADPGAITDNTGGAASATFAAITAGSSYAQADITAIKNALSEVALMLNAIRTALINAGIVA
jgi:hypothetical protein